jgi:hypothetical protein
VNNSARAMMAAQKKFILDLCGAPAAVGGTADAHTVTTNQALSAAHITDGLQISYRAPGTNTVINPTLSIDGTTPAILKRADGTVLAAGSIVSGMILIVQRQDTAGQYYILNIGSLSSEMDIDGLVFDTVIDPVNDWIPFFDDSENANKKTPSRFLAPSEWASFSVHKNGTDQTVSSTSATKVTWSTTTINVGAYFTSNRWTPPAGKVFIQFTAALASVGSGSVRLVIYENGVEAASVSVSSDSDSVASGTVSLMRAATGTSYYEAYVDSSAEASYAVDGTATRTVFMGTMI